MNSWQSGLTNERSNRLTIDCDIVNVGWFGNECEVKVLAPSVDDVYQR